VHVNLRARKPLEPAPTSNAAERALAARVDALLGTGVAHHAAEPAVSTTAIHALAAALSGATSGAIVVGPLAASSPNLAEPLAELSNRLGFPLLLEAASQTRFALANHALATPLFEWLLGAAPGDARLQPELLLCVGHTPVSSAVERWAAKIPRRVILAEHGLPDPLGSAELVASGNLQQGLRALLAELGPRRAGMERSEFCERFLAAHAKTEKRVAEALATAGAAAGAALNEPAVVQALVQSLPDGTTLALGNSLPIRHVDAYVPRAARLRVAVQRGANGIDGLVSGAIGSAIATAGATVLLLGDVSMVHDLSALAAARLVKTPLVVAVIDNAGGRIFDQLPVRELYAKSPEQADLWLTPPSVDFAYAAKTFGIAYLAPRSLDEVRSATLQALATPGVTLLHLHVAPSSAAEQRRSILSQLKSELAPSSVPPARG
jgi:2-succinyl-5-enolpyruvyl-6-hydroxy-3-cyclohexene-1-carboxylate synthase